MQNGTLYIVATPIGNMSDITLRSIEVLKSVSLILSEDTRETSKLLKKLNIEKSQISYRDQNHNRIIQSIIDTLISGQDIALVSDSGTPLISDPGYKLVRDLVEKDFKVISIPGPSALISALVSSGFPTDKFSFLGFLPKSSSQRQKVLKEFGLLNSTLIIYESPFRIIRLLKDINGSLGDRKVCLMSELTKMYEQRICGNTLKMIQKYENHKFKGEFVVLVAKEGF